MTNLKRFLFLFALAILATGLSVGTMAGCSPGRPVANVSGWQTPVSGTLGTTIICNFWEVGNAAANNSGTLDQTIGYVTAYSTGYYVTSDWGNGGVNGCPGNPPPSTSRTAFLYSIANGGTGQYLIMSVPYNTSLGRYDFDAITNGNSGTNVCAPLDIPALTITNATVNGDGTTTADISWTAISNLLGYYDAAPANNIITGCAIRYYTGSSAPSDMTTGSWTLCTNGDIEWGASGTDPGSASVTFPSPASGDNTWLAMSLLFDGQTASVVNPGRGKAQGLTETAFVGASSNPIGPTAAGVFSAFAADKTSQGQLEMSWRSNVEDGVAYYQAYASSSRNGSYQPIDGTKTNAEGNNHVYSVKVPMPRSFSTGAIYVKIRAVKMSGSNSWSDVVTVNTGINPQTGGTGATSNQGGQR